MARNSLFTVSKPIPSSLRRQNLEEAMELDHIWGIWEGEEESTYEQHNWIRQPSQTGNDMRHHIEVHASHREQVWESPSASLIEQDPEVIPDVDIAAQVGKDLFLDEKIPRHESGQGYVRVLEYEESTEPKQVYRGS